MTGRITWLRAAALLAIILPGAVMAQVRPVNGTVACGTEDQAGQIVELRGSNSPLSVVVAPARGGEMIGLGLVTDDARHELLYRGMTLCPSDGWAGKAPILWPATGRNWLVPPNAATAQAGIMGWRHEGQTYPIAIHGFARDEQWQVIGSGVRRGATWLRLRLTDTATTRQAYPFGFVHELEYRLRGTTLELRHTIVAARGNVGGMPFSIGNHLTFRTPISNGAQMPTLTASARRHLPLDAAGRPTGETKDITPFRDVPLAQFGRESAYSLTSFGSSWPAVRLRDDTGTAITISHRGSRRASGDPVLFNLWGNMDKGFFSPEPWWGKQNALVTGDGLVRLEPGERFNWTLRIEVTQGPRPVP